VQSGLEPATCRLQVRRSGNSAIASTFCNVQYDIIYSLKTQIQTSAQ